MVEVGRGEMRERNGEQELIEWSYLGRAQTATVLRWAESVRSGKSTFKTVTVKTGG